MALSHARRLQVKTLAPAYFRHPKPTGGSPLLSPKSSSPAHTPRCPGKASPSRSPPPTSHRPWRCGALSFHVPGDCPRPGVTGRREECKWSMPLRLAPSGRPSPVSPLRAPQGQRRSPYTSRRGRAAQRRPRACAPVPDGRRRALGRRVPAPGRAARGTVGQGWPLGGPVWVPSQSRAAWPGSQAALAAFWDRRRLPPST